MTRTSPNSAISKPGTPLRNTDRPEIAFGPRAEISLPTILANYLAIKAFAPASECGAVVKANAYGHGAAEVSAALCNAGCETFFVAYPEEGMVVRDAVGDELRIFVFNGLSGDDLGLFADHKLSPVCNSVEQVKIWRESKLTPPYALHFDTGMNRLGIPLNCVDELSLLTKSNSPGLVMSHLACADLPGSEENARQLDAFKAILPKFPSARASLSSTGGIYFGPDYHFDLLRPGIGLYGGGPARPPGLKLKPALCLTAPILNVFDIEAGETVGYGCTFEAKRPMTLATVALGYADGYLRSASNYGFGMLRDTPCPVLGRVSMDLTTVDVSDLPERPGIGDRIEFIGPRAGLEIQAEAAGTIGYELTSRLGGRISHTWLTEE